VVTSNAADRGKFSVPSLRNVVLTALASVAIVFKNQPHDRLATKIPISGNFEKTDVDLWTSIGGVLRNAFVRALLPNVDRSVRARRKSRRNPNRPRNQKLRRSAPVL
jgi:hypothetical protein